MVTLAIVGLVVGLVGTLLYQLTNFHTMSTYRYRIQNAVKMAYTKFETRSDEFVKAYQADVLYDPVIANGITVTDDSPNNFTYYWNECEIQSDDGNGGEIITVVDAPLVLPSNGVVDTDFTYIFSTPAKDAEGNNIGSLLFIRENGSAVNELYLDPEGMGTIPVEIQFSIATNNPKAEDRYIYDYKDEENPEKYIGHSVDVVIKSGRDEITNYGVDTSYTLENIMQNNKTINFASDRLVTEAAWGADGQTGPAGWVDGELTGFPTESQQNFTYNNSGEEKTGTYKTITKSGNIIRFISPESYFAEEEVSGTPSAMHASCLSFFAMNGSEMADRVLDNIRLFRDNVLRGTEFGDWFIHQYYYVWSPFLIEHTAFLKPVYQAILIPVSYVCEFIAKL